MSISWINKYAKFKQKSDFHNKGNLYQSFVHRQVIFLSLPGKYYYVMYN